MLQVSSPLAHCAQRVAQSLIFRERDRAQFFRQVIRAISPLLVQPQWIPSELTVPSVEGYRREVLFDDPNGRFTVACLTWAEGQCTPIHDHQAWGVIGVVQGMLRSETFARDPDGILHKRAADEMLVPGIVTTVDPGDRKQADIHRLGSASLEPSVSIHIYGCLLTDINRQRYNEADWH